MLQTFNVDTGFVRIVRTTGSGPGIRAYPADDNGAAFSPESHEASPHR
jgi:hypothetical protein